MSSVALHGVAGWFFQVGEFAFFCGRALRESFRRPWEISEVARQLYEVGWRSLPLIAAAGMAVGAVMSMHTRASMERFGAESLIPTVLALALIKETGPLVTGLLFAGRVGAGIGAELGAMRVSEQVDALESLAVDSFKYLVVTRVIACMIAMPILTTVMNFLGIVGGFVAETAVSGMTFDLYWNRAFASVEFVDYVPSTLKTIVFGFLIGSLSSYLGYYTTGGTAGVGQASTRSVVLASLLVIVVNVVLVKTIFFFFPGAVQ